MEATIGAQLKVVETGFHRRQKHEAAALVKLLSPKMRDALEALERLLESKDEKVLANALALYFKTYRDAVNDVNTDQMQRLIANVKFGGPRQLEVDDDEPQIDYSVREV